MESGLKPTIGMVLEFSEACDAGIIWFLEFLRGTWFQVMAGWFMGGILLRWEGRDSSHVMLYA